MLCFRNLKCSECGSETFTVAIAKTKYPRVIVDCSKCACRISIPVEKWQKSGTYKIAWDFMTFSEENKTCE